MKLIYVQNVRLKLKKGLQFTFKNISRTRVFYVLHQVVPKIGCRKRKGTPVIRF